MSEYKFSFGYLAIKMLGKTLYSNPFAALSELIANGFDAEADSVWVYIDIREKNCSQIVIIDNGQGMTDNDIVEKYLKVGKKNRSIDDNNMMGRKGIGKLAAFYLSNKYYITTKTSTTKGTYKIDFTDHENGTKSEDNDDYMEKISDFDFAEINIFNSCVTGTAIFLTNVNFLGYGEKTFAVLESELAELFIKSEKKIYLKVVYSDSDLKNSYKLIKKKIAFKNMAKIFYNSKDFSDVLALNGNAVLYTGLKNKEIKVNLDIEPYIENPRNAKVNGKEVTLSPKGWIGIHQTIERELAVKNDPDNFINSKFYHFNKVRIYVRGKLALENILPYVHNTQYYTNYIEGEIECNELDDNQLPDIASSSRQDFDKNDDRFIALVEYVKKVVNQLVNFKDDQTKKADIHTKQKQKNAVKELSADIKKTLKNKIGEKLSEKDIDNIDHTIINSFENVGEAIKTKYSLFLSHKRNDNSVSEFIYNFLTIKCGFEEDFIFYTSKPGGISESVETLEKQINKTLTSENTFVVFNIESNSFKKSEYCMFEGGAAWAVKQKDIIGLIYKDYNKHIPTYLKNMKKIKIDMHNPALSRDLYLSIVNMLNDIIIYLNRNYNLEENKKHTISSYLPTDIDLKNRNETLDKYYDKDIVEYWNFYVLSKLLK